MLERAIFAIPATMPAIQFDLFPRNTTVQFDASAPPLLILACSGKKAAVRAPALQLYQGVMYQTYRAQFQYSAAPPVVILAAKHGFVAPGLTRFVGGCTSTLSK